MKKEKRKDHEEFIENAKRKTLRYLCELCVFAFGSKNFCKSIPINVKLDTIKFYQIGHERTRIMMGLK
jgi:hypothetical protein